MEVIRPFRLATTQDRCLSTRTPPPLSVSGVETELRRLLRLSVAKQLRESDHEDLAVKLEEETEEILPVAEDMKEMGDELKQTVDELNEESSQRFEHMCETLCLSQHNARNKFRRTIEVLFNEGISLNNNIVTMVTFTGHVAVFCADQNMEEQTVEVVEEADTFIHDKILPWLLENGGWVSVCVRACVRVCVCVCVLCVGACMQAVFRNCPYVCKMLMIV